MEDSSKLQIWAGLLPIVEHEFFQRLPLARSHLHFVQVLR
jgi:hypothetical protein